ncbi:ABC transporter permease [Paenibacillus faecis]|uniref:ABC transporter permease n=1 Tax=Paenibacillus faecis TaxID=862114 RepID=UPI001BCB6373|nr:ABC transporter permease [Paenibacillus faecis]
MMEMTSNMTAGRLFLRRWADHWKKQIVMLRSVFDGIVLLYIGIPGLLLLGRVYYGLWREALPAWLLHLPFTVFPAYLLLVIYATGGLILFIEAADVLFLKQRPEWIRAVMRRAALVSLPGHFAVIGAAVALAVPVLVRVHGLETGEVFRIFAVACGVKAVHLFLQNLIQIMRTGWRRVLYRSAAFILLGAGFVSWLVMEGGRVHAFASAAVLAACVLLTVLLAEIRFRLRGRFEAEVREEERQRTVLTGLLLAGTMDRPPAVRIRPWLFRRGERLLRSNRPEAVIAESIVKAFFRGPEWRLYAQFVLYGAAAVWFPAYPANLIVFAALLLLFVYWLNGHRQAFFAKGLMPLLPLPEGTEYRAAPLSLRLLLYPGTLLLTCVLGASQFHAWWGVIAGIPAGLLLTRAAASLSGLFTLGRRRHSGKG